jgi:hypothetical protein
MKRAMSGSRPSRIASAQRDAWRRQSAAISASLAVRAARGERRLATGSENALVSLRFGTMTLAWEVEAIRWRAALVASHAGIARAGRRQGVSQAIVSAPWWAPHMRLRTHPTTRRCDVRHIPRSREREVRSAVRKRDRKARERAQRESVPARQADDGGRTLGRGVRRGRVRRRRCRRAFYLSSAVNFWIFLHAFSRSSSDVA